MTAKEKSNAFGTRLREFRQKRGLSQQGLADRCSGEVTKSNISRLETNLEQRPTRPVVEVLSKVLDWPIDEARQLAGYSQIKVDWSKVTASELVHVLENYPKLSKGNRQFVREQIGKLIAFLLEAQERFETKGLTKNLKSIGFEDVLSERDSGKKKRKK
jgi:transcriptional regulator with XRE-family HTH domain